MITSQQPPRTSGDSSTGSSRARVTEWFARRGLQIVSSYGLLVLLALLFAAFSIARPDTFPTAYNLQSIASSKAIVGLAALAVMIPLAAGQFDLSVGYLIGLAEVLTIGLQTKSHLPAGVAILVVLAFGALVGLVNGTVVTRLHVNSFITTLGVGTILSGVDNWYTNGATIQGNLPSGFTDISGNLHGFPYAALFVIAVSFVLWVFLEYRPVGRRLYVIGASPRAAELTGIPIARYVTASFIASGVLAASGGVVLSSSLRVGQPGIGPEYLLPAFAGALLGSTTIRPGRVNVWGTIAAVVTLAVAVSGLELLGAQFYVEDIFNGAILIVAVALAVSAERRRRLGRDGASVSIADSDGSDEPSPPTGAASVQGPAD